MKLARACAALVAVSAPAAAQWTDVRLPEHVYTAVPFMIELKIDCPPPGEAPPPPECNGTMGVWFSMRDKDQSSILPRGFVTVYPFNLVRAGPFTFHKPGDHVIDVLSLSRESPGEVILVGQPKVVVEPPGAANRKK